MLVCSRRQLRPAYIACNTSRYHADISKKYYSALFSDENIKCTSALFMWSYQSIFVTLIAAVLC